MSNWPPPGYPVVPQGFFELTEDWGVTLAEPLARRIEDDAMVLWRPGFTVYVVAWGEGEGQRTRKQRLKDLKREADPDARVVREKDDGEVIRFAYRLSEEMPDGRIESLTAFAVTDYGHLQLGIHFDDKKDEAKALAMVDGIAYAGLPPT